MRFVIQRVQHAECVVDGKTTGAIGKGFLVLIGISDTDTEEIADRMLKKMTGLRIFEDQEGKTNLSLQDVGGELLLISQFTLYGNCRKGRRPEFLSAARPETAIPLYELVIRECRDRGFHVETGVFAADMQVASVNDGPVTILLDTKEL